MLLCNVFHLSVSNSMPKRLDGSGPNFSMATYMTTVGPRKEFLLFKHLILQKKNINSQFVNKKRVAWPLKPFNKTYSEPLNNEYIGRIYQMSS